MATANFGPASCIVQLSEELSVVLCTNKGGSAVWVIQARRMKDVCVSLSLCVCVRVCVCVCVCVCVEGLAHPLVVAPTMTSSLSVYPSSMPTMRT